jgi:methionyl-tRNA synthetase
MSKSLGNVVEPFELADRFGADTVRYFLLREAPFGSDFSFSEAKVLQRRSSDLGNDLGNLVKRSLSMLSRYRGGVVPESADKSFGARFESLGATAGAQLAALDFRGSLDSIWELVSALNRTIDERKPWDLNKQNETERLDAVLYDLSEGLRWLAHLLFPFLPATAGAIWRQLGNEGEPHGAWSDELVWGGLRPGTQTRPEDAQLFPRLEEAVPSA